MFGCMEFVGGGGPCCAEWLRCVPLEAAGSVTDFGGQLHIQTCLFSFLSCFMSVVAAFAAQ